jgi:hypothetical protein
MMKYRERARKAFAASGLSITDLTDEMILDLRKRIDDCMVAAGLIDGSFRMHAPSDIRRLTNGRVISLRCRSRYFEKREAVTFNESGFVGFAGWADEENIVPVLKGFYEWLSSMAKPADVRMAS